MNSFETNFNFLYCLFYYHYCYCYYNVIIIQFIIGKSIIKKYIYIYIYYIRIELYRIIIIIIVECSFFTSFPNSPLPFEKTNFFKCMSSNLVKVGS